MFVCCGAEGGVNGAGLQLLSVKWKELLTQASSLMWLGGETEGVQGNGEDDPPIHLLWFPGYCHMDSLPGLVLGKGLLCEIYWE